MSIATNILILREGVITVADYWLGGGAVAPIFWKTIVFCSKTMEMCDVILPKQ